MQSSHKIVETRSDVDPVTAGAAELMKKVPAEDAKAVLEMLLGESRKRRLLTPGIVEGEVVKAVDQASEEGTPF